MPRCALSTAAPLATWSATQVITVFLFIALPIAVAPAVGETSQTPRLMNPEAVLTRDDYPAESLRRNESGVVSTLLHISWDGRVSSCDVTESSGYATLDARTCALLKSRVRFEPTPSAGGDLLPREYRRADSWGVDDHQPTAELTIPLQVSRLPAEYRAPLKARLIFDVAGHNVTCDVTASSGSDAADRAACAYINRQFTVAPPKSGSSEVQAAAVRYATVSLFTQPHDLPSAK